MTVEKSKPELYNILEYSEYSLLVPKDNQYDFAMVFLAGFNENASKYIYLFKFFIEDFTQSHGIKIKIIIPYLALYKKGEYPTLFIANPDRWAQFYAWYSYEVLSTQDGPIYKIIPNEEKDKLVTGLISEEIKKLGSSEKIIMSGFSMGGRYLMEIITKMKIKTLLNVAFKSILFAYENPFKMIKDDFNENSFYLYYSLYDKIVLYNRAVYSISVLQKNGFKNIHVKVDKSKKHVVDNKCLEHLESLLLQNIKKYIKDKGKVNGIDAKEMKPKF
jgi:predicted esterase